ncbi:MAG TPA: hypothetical protein VNE42_09215 [Acidimicrobiales bacterium]|nr:hypothetical protein [Acidimicrobiales bacterium]
MSRGKRLNELPVGIDPPRAWQPEGIPKRLGKSRDPNRVSLATHELPFGNLLICGTVVGHGRRGHPGVEIHVDRTKAHTRGSSTEVAHVR